MAQAGSVEQDNTIGSWLKPAVLSKTTLSVHAQAGSVEQDSTVGSWFKPVVLRKTTLSVHGLS